MSPSSNRVGRPLLMRSFSRRKRWVNMSDLLLSEHAQATLFCACPHTTYKSSMRWPGCARIEYLQWQSITSIAVGAAIPPRIRIATISAASPALSSSKTTSYPRLNTSRIARACTLSRHAFETWDFSPQRALPRENPTALQREVKPHYEGNRVGVLCWDAALPSPGKY